MEVEDVRRANLRGLIRQAPYNGNQAAFARAVGKPPSLIGRILKGKTLGSDLAREMEQTLKLGRGWFDLLQFTPAGGRILRTSAHARVETTLAASGDVVGPDGEMVTPRGLGELVEIRALEAKAPCPPGTMRPEQKAIVNYMRLDRAFADRVCITAANALQLLEVFGQYMAPVIQAGDVLLIDTGVKNLDVDAVFVIGRSLCELTVKWTQRNSDGSIDLISENKTFAPQRVPAEEVPRLDVLGRVVYAWRGHHV